ncbi:MAG: sulfatase [Candidatus Aminicenantes bacterium]|nr:sulfatase [Candidatus Aminicenantes bacterium]
MKRWILIVLTVLLIGMALLLFILPRSKPLNVVLISIDTLRPDHLGCYGYTRPTSPTIDRLAREGVRFERAFSSTSWTLPAHLALFTGLPDLVHRVMTEDERLDDNRITIAEIFKRNGYRTWGIFTGPFLLPRWGFDQGFDAYMDLTLYDKKLDGAEMLQASERGRTTPGALDKVEDLLSERKDDPFFLFLHLFDVHADFDPPPPYDQMFDPDYSGPVNGIDIMNNPNIHAGMNLPDLAHLVSLYDGEIRFVDEMGISRLMDLLDAHGLLERTLIVITSDHGEEFFEHGVFGHRQNLYDTTLRIPLILWAPGLVPLGVTVKRQIRIIDIMPTVLELCGLSQSPECIGKSLVSYFTSGESKKKELPVFAEVKSWKRYHEALRMEQYKVIHDYKKEEKMYIDLTSDLNEQNPVTKTTGITFKEALDKFFDIRFNLETYKKTLIWSNRAVPEMDEELRQRLRSLGYLK